MTRRVLIFWAIAVALLATRMVWGQAKEDKGPFIERVQWGFTNSMPIERFAPVTVWINGGRTGFTGTVSLAYRQDATQKTRIVTAASATPGRTTPVELVCALPNGCDDVEILLTDDRSSRGVRFTRQGSDSTLALPLSEDLFEILMIGETGVGAASKVTQNQAAPRPAGSTDAMTIEQRAAAFWGRVFPTALGQELPLNWIAYDSIDMVVVRADALVGVDPRRVEALAAWIGAGGRCVIVVDQGLAWRRLLGEDESGDLVSLGDVTWLTPDEGAYAPMNHRIGPRVRGRLVTLTALGERDGWRLIVPARGVDDAPGALIAVGPVGMGMVCVLASDPKDWVTDPGSEASGIMWRPVVEGMAPSKATVTDEYRWYWYWGGSLGGMYETVALRASVDRVAKIPPLGVTSLLLIGGVILLLGVLLGPVDLLVLKRLGWRHRSWLVALGWIALASVLATVTPWMIRSGETEVFQHESVDVLPRGELVERWRTGVTAFFSGRPGRYELRAMESGGVWRGVSVLNGGVDSAPLAFGELPIVQRQADSGGREAMPGPMGMGQWMLRTIMEQAPGRVVRSGEVSASVRVSDGVPAVVVDGLAPGVSLEGARLRTSQGWSDLALTRDAHGVWRGTTTGPFTPEQEWRWTQAKEMASSWYGQQVSMDERVERFSAVNSLPMAIDREAAVAARVAGGRWACVYLDVAGVAGGVTFEEGVVARRVSLRLMAPLATGDEWPRAERRWPGMSLTENMK